MLPQLKAAQLGQPLLVPKDGENFFLTLRQNSPCCNLPVAVLLCTAGKGDFTFPMLLPTLRILRKKLDSVHLCLTPPLGISFLFLLLPGAHFFISSVREQEGEIQLRRQKDHSTECKYAT